MVAIAQVHIKLVITSDTIFYHFILSFTLPKNDTFTVEGVNADLRHYIPTLRRRSRCFPRKLDTLLAVLEVFAEAYNAFGVAKMIFRQNRDIKSRELPFSLLDFL